METKVYISNCIDYNESKIRTAFKETILDNNLLDFVKPKMKIAIKVNLVAAATPDKAVTTNPVLVKVLCEEIVKRGAYAIIGDSPGGLFNSNTLRNIYKESGMLSLVSENISVNDNFNQEILKINLHIAYCKSINDFLKKYQDDFFEIVDKTYENIYQTVPFTEKMKENLVKSFKLIVNEKHVATIVDENDKVVAFGLCFPSIAKAINKCQGHLTPIGIIRLLHAIKHPHVIDLGLIGVLPEYQMKGIASALISAVMDMLENKEIEYAETNLNLEDNHNIQNQWKSFDSVIHKRRRAFVKKI